MEYSGNEELQNLKFAQNYNKHLVSFLEPFVTSNMKVVDFGAGIGTFSEKVQNTFQVRVECVEIDPKQNKILKNLGFNTYHSIEEIEDNSCDVIYSYNVLEHIEDDREALRKINKKLKVDGVLVLYVPAMQCLYSVFDEKVGHFRRYWKSDLKQKLEEIDWQLKNIYFVDSLGFLVAYLFKLIDSGSGTISVTSIKIYDRFIFPLSKLCDFIFKRFIGKNLISVVQKK